MVYFAPRLLRFFFYFNICLLSLFLVPKDSAGAGGTNLSFIIDGNHLYFNQNGDPNFTYDSNGYSLYNGRRILVEISELNTDGSISRTWNVPTSINFHGLITQDPYATMSDKNFIYRLKYADDLTYVSPQKFITGLPYNSFKLTPSYGAVIGSSENVYYTAVDNIGAYVNDPSRSISNKISLSYYRVNVDGSFTPLYMDTNGIFIDSGANNGGFSRYDLIFSPSGAYDPNYVFIRLRYSVYTPVDVQLDTKSNVILNNKLTIHTDAGGNLIVNNTEDGGAYTNANSIADYVYQIKNQMASKTALTSSTSTLSTKIDAVESKLNTISNYLPPTLTKISGYGGALATSSNSFKVSLAYSNATEYRLQLDGGVWGSWTPLTTHDSSGYLTVNGLSSNGPHVINIEIRNPLAPVTVKGNLTVFKL